MIKISLVIRLMTEISMLIIILIILTSTKYLDVEFTIIHYSVLSVMIIYQISTYDKEFYMTTLKSCAM